MVTFSIYLNRHVFVMQSNFNGFNIFGTMAACSLYLKVESESKRQQVLMGVDTDAIFSANYTKETTFCDLFISW